MALKEQVQVARRFQRSVRIDTDLADPMGLEGFICPPSSAAVLETMASHAAQTGQGAFTWTGPYGAGKSSLAVALSGLLNGDSQKRTLAAKAIGQDTAGIVWNSFPPRGQGWRILPIAGEQVSPEELFGKAINAQRIPGITQHRKWSPDKVLSALHKISQEDPEDTGGLIVLIDEMGKVLEGAARDGHDIHFFQQLAEYASRSSGRLIVVGILHQAFEEYAHRGSREMRDEWAKVQGRFVDLPVNASPEEQIFLIGKAVEASVVPDEFAKLCLQVANLTRRQSTPELEQLLQDCWPLHPITTSLLGPISRRRFGQNQRSIFGFLNSAEPYGFQEFLSGADEDDLFGAEALWDYLRLNLEPSILASPDAHRWTLAAEILDQCHAQGGREEDSRVVKIIALLDLFRERSGLTASPDIICAALPDLSQEIIRESLDRLRMASHVIYRNYNDSFSLFEGSDFDLEAEVSRIMSSSESPSTRRMCEIANLEPVIAKRHYHEFGAMRWFNLSVATLDDLESNSHGLIPEDGAAGVFLLVLPQRGMGLRETETTIERALRATPGDISAIGLPPNARKLDDLSRELTAIEQVRHSAPDLAGDPVARREVEIKAAALRGLIQNEISDALDGSMWFIKGYPAKILLSYAELNSLASELANKRFNKSPKINNELLNRDKPSSNAVAAQNALIRRMASHEGTENLSIEGHPAEWGIFASVLEAGALYKSIGEEWHFVSPGNNKNQDPCRLRPLWDTALEILQVNRARTVALSEIQERWAGSPFGVKRGLLPVITAAFILSNKRELAFYRQGVFQPRVTDLDMEYLARDAGDVQVRWMDLSQRSRELLSEMAAIVREIDRDNTLVVHQCWLDG